MFAWLLKDPDEVQLPNPAVLCVSLSIVLFLKNTSVISPFPRSRLHSKEKELLREIPLQTETFLYTNIFSFWNQG